MKITALLLSLGLTLSLNSQAHQIDSKLKTMSNPLVESLSQEARAWSKAMGTGAVFGSFRIVEIKPAQGPGESLEDAMIRALKSQLHREYPITGDDGGYNFGNMNGATEHQIQYNMDDWFSNGDEPVSASIQRMLPQLHEISQQKDLVLLYGGGAGNNTHAGIIAVLDLKNQEVLFLLVSNFGSDD